MAAGDRVMATARRPRKPKEQFDMPGPQRPIGSGFGAASTAGEVIEGIDLSGRTAIVTGCHSGLGLETTRRVAVTPLPPNGAQTRVVPAGESRTRSK
ncbi:hypothetical protein ACQEVC_26845 [Plantactinospora sp. CA-294935]|uniref:hypothetical protein n=1 Tax=Plantactinospora sp. CA-294935 TaxID=3240012 RepID=UPI003D8ED617